jgi:hypothetical protein
MNTAGTAKEGTNATDIVLKAVLQQNGGQAFDFAPTDAGLENWEEISKGKEKLSPDQLPDDSPSLSEAQVEEHFITLQKSIDTLSPELASVLVDFSKHEKIKRQLAELSSRGTVIELSDEEMTTGAEFDLKTNKIKVSKNQTPHEQCDNILYEACNAKRKKIYDKIKDELKSAEVTLAEYGQKLAEKEFEATLEYAGLIYPLKDDALSRRAQRLKTNWIEKSGAQDFFNLEATSEPDEEAKLKDKLKEAFLNSPHSVEENAGPVASLTTGEMYIYEGLQTLDTSKCVDNIKRALKNNNSPTTWYKLTDKVFGKFRDRMVSEETIQKKEAQKEKMVAEAETAEEEAEIIKASEAEIKQIRATNERLSALLKKLETLKDQELDEDQFQLELSDKLTPPEVADYKTTIFEFSKSKDIPEHLRDFTKGWPDDPDLSPGSFLLIVEEVKKTFPEVADCLDSASGFTKQMKAVAKAPLTDKQAIDKLVEAKGIEAQLPLLNSPFIQASLKLDISANQIQELIGIAGQGSATSKNPMLSQLKTKQESGEKVEVKEKVKERIEALLATKESDGDSVKQTKEAVKKALLAGVDYKKPEYLVKLAELKEKVKKHQVVLTGVSEVEQAFDSTKEAVLEALSRLQNTIDSYDTSNKSLTFPKKQWKSVMETIKKSVETDFVESSKKAKK